MVLGMQLLGRNPVIQVDAWSQQRKNYFVVEIIEGRGCMTEGCHFRQPTQPSDPSESKNSDRSATQVLAGLVQT